MYLSFAVLAVNPKNRIYVLKGIHMNNKSIIITGGAGFIGSNLAETLADDNEVTVIDDLSTGYQQNIQHLIDENRIRFVNGSICNLDLLQKEFADVDIVFHEAAIPSVPRSVADPIQSNAANIDGSLNVLVAARDNAVDKVVYASSSSVYGDSPTLPKHEDMNPNPLSPYAVNKLTAEYYCKVFTEVYGLKTVALRYFNVFGPRQDPTSEYAAVVPKFIQAISEGKSPVIYGDGEQSRDFTFIDNVVQANIKAAEHNSVTGVFNTACGSKMTVNELAKELMNIIGKQVEVIYEPPRPGDIKHSLADSSKAKNAFGFDPKVSIKEGLRETVAWFLK
jgi:UDP-glucose 4-epimerase